MTDAPPPCCADNPTAAEAAAAAQARLRRITLLVSLACLVFVAGGLIVGGPVGGAVVALTALALLGSSLPTWGTLTINERLLRVAVIVLLLGLAAVRAFPR